MQLTPVSYFNTLETIRKKKKQRKTDLLRKIDKQKKDALLHNRYYRNKQK